MMLTRVINSCQDRSDQHRYKVTAYIKDKWKLRIVTEDSAALEQAASSLGGA